MNLDDLFGLSHHDESRSSCWTYHQKVNKDKKIHKGKPKKENLCSEAIRH